MSFKNEEVGSSAQGVQLWQKAEMPLSEQLNDEVKVPLIVTS